MTRLDVVRVGGGTVCDADFPALAATYSLLPQGSARLADGGF
jgi:hypothetical protein